MSARVIICIVVTIISALIITFSPQLNFIGHAGNLSLFDEYLKQGEIWAFIKHAGGLTLLALFAIIILTKPSSYGKKKSDKESAEEQEQ